MFDPTEPLAIMTYCFFSLAICICAIMAKKECARRARIENYRSSEEEQKDAEGAKEAPEESKASAGETKEVVVTLTPLRSLEAKSDSPTRPTEPVARILEELEELGDDSSTGAASVTCLPETDPAGYLPPTTKVAWG